MFEALRQKLHPLTTFLVLFGMVLLVGGFLRLERYDTLLRFNADQVRDIKIIQQMEMQGDWPLLGPKAGGTEFQLGPAFYYLEYLSGTLFGFTPSGTTLLIPILSLASLVLLYQLFRFIFSPTTSLTLMSIAATSFYLIKYARFGWNPNFLLFFLLLFLLALLHIIDPKEKHPLRWYAVLGVSTGIGMQLHTLSLLLVPFLFLIACGMSFLSARTQALRRGGLTLALVFLCFLPVFLSEITTQGANIQAFFAGIGMKTEDKATDLNPLLVTFDFVLQGTAVVLTGYEPRGQWINPDAWKKAFSGINTLLFLFSLVITLGGSWLTLQKLRSASITQDERRFYWGTVIFFITTLILFFLIGNELNLRFFIILSLLPLLWLGMWLTILESFLHKRQLSKIYPFICLATILLLGASNIQAYQNTYTFSRAESITKSYGGISLSEAAGLAQAISKAIETHPHYSKRLASFEHERSLQYFLDAQNINLKTTKENSDSPEGRFLILPLDARVSALDRYTGKFEPRQITQVGRFKLYWLDPLLKQ